MGKGINCEVSLAKNFLESSIPKAKAVFFQQRRTCRFLRAVLNVFSFVFQSNDELMQRLSTINQRYFSERNI